MVVLQSTFTSYSSSVQAYTFQMRYPFFALNKDLAAFTKYEPNFPEFNI